jgi:hypothetical protein
MGMIDALKVPLISFAALCQSLADRWQFLKGFKAALADNGKPKLRIRAHF